MDFSRELVTKFLPSDKPKNVIYVLYQQNYLICFFFSAGCVVVLFCGSPNKCNWIFSVFVFIDGNNNKWWITIGLSTLQCALGVWFGRTIHNISISGASVYEIFIDISNALKTVIQFIFSTIILTKKQKYNKKI